MARPACHASPRMKELVRSPPSAGRVQLGFVQPGHKTAVAAGHQHPTASATVLISHDERMEIRQAQMDGPVFVEAPDQSVVGGRSRWSVSRALWETQRCLIPVLRLLDLADDMQSPWHVAGRPIVHVAGVFEVRATHMGAELRCMPAGRADHCGLFMPWYLTDITPASWLALSGEDALGVLSCRWQRRTRGAAEMAPQIGGCSSQGA